MKDAHGLLIVTDLDGTLLDGNGVVPEKNLRAIERFKAAGGRFTIASGRYGKSIESLFPGYQRYVNAPTIFSNGAVIFDEEKGSPISEVTGLAHDLIPKLESVKAALPEMDIFPVVMRDGSLVRQWCCEVGEDERIYKTLFRGETELIERGRAYVEEHFPGFWATSLSCPSLLELVLPDATKGASLRRLKKWFADRGEIIKTAAVGDYENDLDMLRAADISACPANAIPTVKAAAKIRLCDHNDGCIADLVDRLLEGRM